MKNDVNELLEHLFRHKSAQLVSILTRIFGAENLDLAEDVVQETLVKTLQQWPYTGVPRNPGGWILQTAKNQALDVLRRRSRFRQKQAQIAQALENSIGSLAEATHEPFPDEQLTMMFLCCHPAFAAETQVMLMLKTLCGFSIAEIARAFVSQESAVAQRLVRAKRKIKKEKLRFEIPPTTALQQRLNSVLAGIYLLFNEGYSATEGQDLIRRDLCAEALRLGNLLAESEAGNFPQTHALLALLYFQASRLPARVDTAGNILLLSDQDRSLWDRHMIAFGFQHLQHAGQGEELTRYHLEAAIASCHAMASNYQDTDWKKILALYDSLLVLDDSPIVRLNRAVAVSHVSGPEAGIAILEQITDESMQRYHLFYATYADFHARSGQLEKAREFYKRTTELCSNQSELLFVKSKLR